MFGTGKSSGSEQKEQEIDRQKLAARQLLQSMHDTDPVTAGQIVERIKIFLQNDKLLDFQIRQKIAKSMCEANMRAADRLLHEAAALMDIAELRQRGQKLAESRRHFAKVCQLGGDDKWRTAYHRLCETIMMSGGVAFDHPSRAKPADLAPKPPDLAKG